MLFNKIRKTRQPVNSELDKVFDRLQSMREQIGHREVPVADLFGMAVPDEAPVRWPHAPKPAKSKEEARVRPEDVPPVKGYVGWE